MTIDEPFPLSGKEFKRDPYAAYARLREAGPIHRVEFPSGVVGWLVTGHDAALERLSDARMGKRHALGNEDWRALAAIMPEPQHSLLQVHLLHQDPPVHTRMRRPVADALAPRVVARRRGRIERIADELLDDVAPRGGAELVTAFAAPFSLAVLSEMIGLPEHLHVPRRSTPRTRVPAGSVGLAGPFAGAYPRASPGGWQLVGRTDAVLFDVDRDPPALLVPGARVRFREVG